MRAPSSNIIIAGGWMAMGLFYAASAQTLALPPRAATAMAGREFSKSLGALPLAEREAQVLSQITSGNVPNFLRRLRPVSVTNFAAGRTNAAAYYVTPDYLAVGSDADYFLIPLTPSTAQQLADRLQCTLPTRKMVDDIYAAAAVKLAPSNLPPSAAMTTMEVFNQHNEIIARQRSLSLGMHPLGSLVAGHKKDVVLTPRLAAVPGRVAIYGWHRLDGRPIQPLYSGHTKAWVDYSHGIRLVQRTLRVDAVERQISDVLADPDLAPLLSDEGPILSARYEMTESLPAAIAEVASAAVISATNSPEPWAGFHPGFHPGEQILDVTREPGVKMQINAPSPANFATNKPVDLIFYALPNGNTIAQTVGRKLRPGDDWRYNIQHIGAQLRYLRNVLPGRTLVIVYLEAKEQSWPTWRRKQSDQIILALVEAEKLRFKGFPTRLTLSGHSGGGSFVIGYLNAVERIPDEIERIAFLDSNYAYDPARGHAEKLAGWLKQSDAHFLSVLAYHDDIARLDGKPFVSATGGTWYRSHLMQTNLAAHFTFKSESQGDIEKQTALDGRIEFLLHTNPERAILHTVQVEKNGFIQSILSGTRQEGKGYLYFGPRAYETSTE